MLPTPYDRQQRRPIGMMTRNASHHRDIADHRCWLKATLKANVAALGTDAP
jgi:hypothetical protein